MSKITNIIGQKFNNWRAQLIIYAIKQFINKDLL